MAMYYISHLFPIDQIFSRPDRGIVAEEALNVGRYDLSADAILGHEPIPKDVSRHGGARPGCLSTVLVPERCAQSVSATRTRPRAVAVAATRTVTATSGRGYPGNPECGRPKGCPSLGISKGPDAIRSKAMKSRSVLQRWLGRREPGRCGKRRLEGLSRRYGRQG